jgi:hypothetical protein
VVGRGRAAAPAASIPDNQPTSVSWLAVRADRPARA